MHEEESRGYPTTSKESSTNTGPPSGEIGGLPAFRYDEDVLNENRDDITEGVLLRELNLQAARIDKDFPHFAEGSIDEPRGRPA